MREKSNGGTVPPHDESQWHMQTIKTIMGHFQIRICAAARCPYGFSTADISAWGNNYRWWCHTTVHAVQFTLQSFLEMSCGIILVVLVAWMHSGGIFSHGEATKYFLVHAPCKFSQLSFQTSFQTSALHFSNGKDWILQQLTVVNSLSEAEIFFTESTLSKRP